MSALAEQAVARTPRRLAPRFRGMSDRAIAWLFIAPTVLTELADGELTSAEGIRRQTTLFLAPEFKHRGTQIIGLLARDKSPQRPQNILLRRVSSSKRTLVVQEGIYCRIQR